MPTLQEDLERIALFPDVGWDYGCGAIHLRDDAWLTVRMQLP